MSEQWTSGMAWSDIAASAYRAYAASMGTTMMPQWEHLPKITHIAWEAAVRQAGECIGLLGNTRPPDEQRFQGWVPPHFREPTP